MRMVSVSISSSVVYRCRAAAPFRHACTRSSFARRRTGRLGAGLLSITKLSDEFIVTPAKAGAQFALRQIGSGLRREDDDL